MSTFTKLLHQPLSDGCCYADRFPAMLVVTYNLTIVIVSDKVRSAKTNRYTVGKEVLNTNRKRKNAIGRHGLELSPNEIQI